MPSPCHNITPRCTQALEAMKSAKLKRVYYDFADMLRTNPSGNVPYTPCLSLLYGLRESIKMWKEEGGMEAVAARHHRCRLGAMRGGAAGRHGCAADTCTAIRPMMRNGGGRSLAPRGVDCVAGLAGVDQSGGPRSPQYVGCQLRTLVPQAGGGRAAGGGRLGPEAAVQEPPVRTDRAGGPGAGGAGKGAAARDGIWLKRELRCEDSVGHGCWYGCRWRSKA